MVDYEIWDDESDTLLYATNSKEEMQEILTLFLSEHPNRDLLEELYLTTYEQEGHGETGKAYFTIYQGYDKMCEWLDGL